MVPTIAIATVVAFVIAGLSRPALRPRLEKGGRLDVHLFMMLVISLVALAVAVYFLLDRTSNDASKKWAFGIFGTLLGYWSKPSK